MHKRIHKQGTYRGVPRAHLKMINDFNTNRLGSTRCPIESNHLLCRVSQAFDMVRSGASAPTQIVFFWAKPRNIPTTDLHRNNDSVYGTQLYAFA